MRRGQLRGKKRMKMKKKKVIGHIHFYTIDIYSWQELLPLGYAMCCLHAAFSF